MQPLRFKLDENIGSRCIDLFRSAGHDVSTVVQQNMMSATDRDLIQHCHAERRCLVTLDLDFSNPLIFVPSLYSGIAVFRLPKRPEASDLAELTVLFLKALEKEAIIGLLWIVQRDRVRVYQQETREN